MREETHSPSIEQDETEPEDLAEENSLAWFFEEDTEEDILAWLEEAAEGILDEYPW